MDRRWWYALGGVAIGLIVLLVIVALANNGDDDDSADSDAEATETAAAASPSPQSSPTIGATPTVQVTPPPGMPAAVMSGHNAMESGNPAALVASLAYFDRACTAPQGVGSFVCPAGSPPGTVHKVISYAVCEGAWLVQGDDARILEEATKTAVSGQKLYAIARGPDPNFTGVPSDYILIYSQASGRGRSLLAGPSGISSMWQGCGEQTAAEIAARYTNFIVPPPTQ